MMLAMSTLKPANWSDGEIIDRFYKTCMDCGKDPKEFYGRYGGRKAFCISVRKFAIDKRRCFDEISNES